MIEALKGDYDLAVLTWLPPNFNESNRFFGSALRAGEIELHVMPAIGRALFRVLPVHAFFLKELIVMRRARRLAPRFDVLVYANNEADLGAAGIQYVHYPRFAPDCGAKVVRWYHRPGWLRAYYWLAQRLTGFSPVRMRSNRTLANSEWTARRVYGVHGIEAETLYPPVLTTFPTVAWHERENGCVVLGRLAPEKRLEEAIEIVRRVRECGHDLRLHLIGVVDDRRYVMRLRETVREYAAWVTLHENLARDELVDLVSRQRFALHAMPEEHFGIAVAEFLHAGCIPFVAAGGGSVEIVDGDPRLLFGSIDEASAKICRVLEDPTLQESLRRQLAALRNRFSLAAFTDGIRRVVAEASRSEGPTRGSNSRVGTDSEP